jgi:predicted PolB exonuclease-like 3'-5' exonuclease
MHYLLTILNLKIDIMSEILKQIKPTDICFFDIEVVRNSEHIDTDSKEFKLFRKKVRNKETDELPSVSDTIELYKQKAGLKPVYNKIVCISIGAIYGDKLDKVYIKSLLGSEEEIIREFYNTITKYKYLCGFNLSYDLPITRINALRYDGLVDLIPDRFNDSMKKPWELKSLLDLMTAVSGINWIHPSLDEICWHLGIKSPKDGEIDGSMVSDVYYSEGVDKIEKYCKEDVLATINLYLHLIGVNKFTSYVDGNKISNKKNA